MACSNSSPSAIGKWLDKQYLDWQHSIGEKKTWGQFAEELLGSTIATLHRWSSGQQKSYDPALVEQFADRTGDDEIYALTGVKPPDPSRKKLLKTMDDLPPEVKEILSKVGLYAHGLSLEGVKSILQMINTARKMEGLPELPIGDDDNTSSG